MTMTRKDVVATALVAAVVVIYACFLAFDGFAFVQDVKGMAVVALVLGFASRRIGGRHGFRHERLASLAGMGSLALGFIALGTESGVVLALAVGSIVVLWGAAMYARFQSSHGTRDLAPTR